MKYMGSKKRIAKYILPIILKDRKPNQWYVEPFVGGANLIDKVDGNRIGSDLNVYLIALYYALQNGWEPPISLTQEEFTHIKNNKSQYPYHILGYVGFQLSYGAMWFDSYRRDAIGNRDYPAEAYRNVMAQIKSILKVHFFNCGYFDLELPVNSIIYCDPPYKGTKKYRTLKKDFNHSAFWNWCKLKSIEGHRIFISEYAAPNDFKCIWEKEINANLCQNRTGKRGIERLFTPGGLP